MNSRIFEAENRCGFCSHYIYTQHYFCGLRGFSGKNVNSNTPSAKYCFSPLTLEEYFVRLEDVETKREIRRRKQVELRKQKLGKTHQKTDENSEETPMFIST